MMYKSTRDVNESVFFGADVIKQGIASDNGLFVPESFPSIDSEYIEALIPLNYAQRAAQILSLYLTDYKKEVLLRYCNEAYSENSFGKNAAPVRAIHDNIYSLELWHGPTCAFKDMALQIMPRLLSGAIEKTAEKKTALILVATSGDTGKAALEGYRDVEHTKIMVFYPANGVSDMQKLQMITQEGKNVNVCAIDGNFDDAQTGVKKIFADSAINKALSDSGYFLSSANSINWGRLAPQIVYYISAYCDLVNAKKIKNGEKINVCVPTGNFGNILAGFIAKKMGLPINRLVCASNSNNVLTDFLNTGCYDKNRSFKLTISPSMDILISSNLERLLYFVSDAETVSSYMKSLAECGKYTVNSDIKKTIDESFTGLYASEEETRSTIKNTFDNYKYLCDTHTAVAVSCAERYLKESNEYNMPMLVVSTASPYKFAADVYYSLTEKNIDNAQTALEELSSLSGTEIPTPLKDLEKRNVVFDGIINVGDMSKKVCEFAK